MILQLNFNQLYVYYLCIKFGSYKHVSEKLNVSVPAVNMQIKKLEDFLGFELFLRKEGKLLPTQQTIEIYPKLESMFLEAEVLNSQLHTLSHKLKKKIIIGMHLVPAQSMIPKFKQCIEEHLPEVELDFVLGDYKNLIHKMYKHEVDIAFVAVNTKLENTYMQKFYSAEILSICASDNPILNNSPISLEDFPEINVFIGSKGTEFSDHIMNFFLKNNLLIKNINDKANLLIVKNIIPKTQDIAFFPDFMIKDEIINHDFVSVNLEKKPDPLVYYLVCPIKQYDNKTFKDIFRTLEKHLDGFN